MRRTQLGKKPKMSNVPAGRLRWAWRAWVRKHTSKECFAESDMISEAAHSCRATRGHTSAYRDAERLGRPATESGKHGTTGAPRPAVLTLSSGVGSTTGGTAWNNFPAVLQLCGGRLCPGAFATKTRVSRTSRRSSSLCGPCAVCGRWADFHGWFRGT